MKKMRIFLASVLCISLLAFAGCGSDENNNNDGMNDGTVTEETVDRNNDSITDDMADGAKDAVDDVEDAVDGNDNRDNSNNSNAAQETKNR